MSWENIWEHLYLVVISCICVTAVGVPLGIYSYLRPRQGKWILTAVDLLQTVPVLAIMGLLMTVFGANSVTVIFFHGSVFISPGGEKYKYGAEQCFAGSEGNSGCYGNEPEEKAALGRTSHGLSFYPDRNPHYCCDGCWNCGFRHICRRRRTGKYALPRYADTGLFSYHKRNVKSDGNVCHFRLPSGIAGEKGRWHL